MQFQVSVIIPVYNASKYIVGAVSSALQLPEVAEVILVDDGSTDDSLAVCSGLASTDARVKVLQHQNGVNKGAGASRNLGLQNAGFPFIAFLDSDDVYFNNRFKGAKAIMENDPTVDGVYDMVTMVNELNGDEKPFGIKSSIGSNNLFRNILRGGYFHTNSLTVRRDFLRKTGYYFVQNCWPHEDVEMWLRMAYSGKLVGNRDSQPVATYRIHGSNLGTNDFSNTSRATLWKTVFDFFFFKNIGFVNRLIIVKQIGRYKLALLRVSKSNKLPG